MTDRKEPSMAEVMRVLYQDHRNLAKLLNVLERQLAVFEDSGLPDYDVIRGVLDYCTSYPDVCHHPKEDLVLNALSARDAAAADRVGDLRADHEELAALTARFLAQVHRVMAGAELPRDWFGNMARDFLDSYRNHMAMEEEVFFPLAEETLMPEDWAQIDAKVSDRDDPLFGERVEQRFRELRERILDWDRGP
jgi:hemerythrin-like domain-containing protein